MKYVNIWKYIPSSLSFFPFGLSCIFIVWSGLFLDKTFPVARGLNLYKNLLKFSVKQAVFYLKIT